jgi:hypothetical protein
MYPLMAAIDVPHKHTEREHMLSAAVSEGVRWANMDPKSLETQLAVEDMFRARQQSIFEAPLEEQLLSHGMDTDLLAPHTNARVPPRGATFPEWGLD